MKDPEFVKILKQDAADLKKLGVRKTPSFFANGKPLTSFGARQLKALVEKEIAANY
jgi:protein-disulfide isomerase